MAKLLKLRRGTDTQHSTFTGAEGEVTVNTTNDSLHVHDGTTAGGTELAKADLSNVDGSLSNSLGFADNVKARFGDGNDLEIYHDGSNSYIREAGTGDLLIQGVSVVLESTTGENYIHCADNGKVTLYWDNVSKLTTESTGINVTGSVTCDGLTTDGVTTLATTSGQVIVKDTDSSGTAAQSNIRFQDSASTQLGVMGYIGTADSNFKIVNSQNAEVLFGTNGADKVKVTNGGFEPVSTNTFDLGNSSLQWRNGWFDGTVYCDGLTASGDITLENNTGIVVLKDVGNTGSSAQQYISARSSDNTQQWYLGQTSSGGNSVEFMQVQNGILQFGTNNTFRAYITNGGHFYPYANNTYDLGGSSNRWRNVYTNDLNLSNEGGSNDVDGTWGSWTIQEGEDDLFLLNRRNGKKYKFNLSEVN